MAVAKFRRADLADDLGFVAAAIECLVLLVGCEGQDPDAGLLAKTSDTPWADSQTPCSEWVSDRGSGVISAPSSV